uniref:Probable splicing factor, arginine/serine-rich 7 n=1 Tax=Crassostrea virginica TaxID=6565 RepID=A0A8B8E291_CRAVI|nr:probable splicing factor, arginine/serine-rich 7 [Crassostrea virginica]
MAEDLDCFLCKCALHYVQYLDLLNGDTARPTGGNDLDEQVKLQQHEQLVNEDYGRRPRSHSARRRYTPSPLPPPPSRRSLPDFNRNQSYRDDNNNPYRDKGKDNNRHIQRQRHKGKDNNNSLRDKSKNNRYLYRNKGKDNSNPYRDKGKDVNNNPYRDKSKDVNNNPYRDKGKDVNNNPYRQREGQRQPQKLLTD